MRSAWRSLGLAVLFALAVAGMLRAGPRAVAEADPPASLPTVSFSQASYTAGESGGAILILQRQGPTAAAQFTIDFAAAGLSAQPGIDFQPITGTLEFFSGQWARSFNIPTIDNAVPQPDRQFQVSLSNPQGVELGAIITATVTIVDEDTPELHGQWGEVIDLPTMPIHLSLLPTGQLLFWDIDDPLRGYDGTPHLWDLDAAQFAALDWGGVNVFCAGHAFLPDGRLLIAGGHVTDTVGLDQASFYDPADGSFTQLPAMNDGRWYPTVSVLPNGDALVLGGSIAPGVVNRLPQVWQANGGWRDLTTANLGSGQTWSGWYPYLYLAPDGRIFNPGPQTQARLLNTAGSGAWQTVGAARDNYRYDSASVQLVQGQYMLLGGSASGAFQLPLASVEVIDLNAAQPAWSQAAPLTVGRRQFNAVLLPDGQVLAVGGSGLAGFNNAYGAIYYPEMYDPAANAWSIMASHTRYRGYHSAAILLPDARVLVTGGGHNAPVGGASELNAEIYSPPYLFRGARPVISAVPEVISQGQPFTVSTPHAASIARVTLMRLSSYTHGFNQNQAVADLSFEAQPDGLQVSLPASINLLPPGHYMLFILNADGVPSVAPILRLDALPAPQPMPDTAATLAHMPVTINLLANDMDPGGHPLAVAHLQPALHGTAVLSGTAHAVYTPTAGFYGVDVFTYTVTNGYQTAAATVTITVAPYTQYLPFLAGPADSPSAAATTRHRLHRLTTAPNAGPHTCNWRQVSHHQPCWQLWERVSLAIPRGGPIKQ